VHRLRPEYQDRANFGILDYDIGERRDFAGEMGAAWHPAFTVPSPNSGPEDAAHRKFEPLNEGSLSEVFDELVAKYGQ
jgi:hypothetical protein